MSIERVAEWSGWACVVLALAMTVRRREAWMAGSLGALLFCLAGVWVADATMGIGITTRYLSLAFIPFVLAILGVATHHGRAGLWVLLALLSLEGVGLSRYLFQDDYARAEWRDLMERLSESHRPEDLVLGFPVHHLEVAASTYAPGLSFSGGFTGKPGQPIYLMREGTRFAGYAFEGNLVRVDQEVTAALRARVGARRVFLVTYEDESRHGDTRLLVAALSPGRLVATHRFNGRDPLLLREFSKILD